MRDKARFAAVPLAMDNLPAIYAVLRVPFCFPKDVM